MDVQLNIQYITDTSGNKTAVMIPISEWEAFKAEYEKLFLKQQLRAELKQGLNEIQQMVVGKTPEVTLEQFLNEC